MSLNPTREEWLEAHRKIRLRIGHVTAARSIVEDVLGPCPPEPEPMCGRQIGSLRLACRRPENHPDACRPFLMDGDPPTEHVRRYGRETGSR